MSAWRLWAALLVLLAPATAAAQHADPPMSLIVGHWLSEGRVVGVPCPRDNICLNVIGDVRFGQVRTLAGPPVAKRVTARFEFHARIIDSVDLILLVRPVSNDGLLEGWWVRTAWPGRPVCVDPDLLASNGIARSAGAIRRKHALCFPAGAKRRLSKQDFIYSYKAG